MDKHTRKKTVVFVKTKPKPSNKLQSSITISICAMSTFTKTRLLIVHAMQRPAENISDGSFLKMDVRDPRLQISAIKVRSYLIKFHTTLTRVVARFYSMVYCIKTFDVNLNLREHFEEVLKIQHFMRLKMNYLLLRRIIELFSVCMH